MQSLDEGASGIRDPRHVQASYFEAALLLTRTGLRLQQPDGSLHGVGATDDGRMLYPRSAASWDLQTVLALPVEDDLCICTTVNLACNT